MEGKRYITSGKSELSLELFRNALRPFNNYTYKPDGGL